MSRLLLWLFLLQLLLLLPRPHINQHCLPAGTGLHAMSQFLPETHAHDRLLQRVLHLLRELSRRVDSFVLRRTNEINARYLPPLTNCVVFCRPSHLQVTSSNSISSSPWCHQNSIPTTKLTSVVLTTPSESMCCWCHGEVTDCRVAATIMPNVADPEAS